MIKDISLLLNAVGVGNCFLFSYTYLIKKEPKALPVNHILSLLFFVIGIVILNTILNFSGYSHLLYGFEPLSNALTYTIAPLLYLYVQALNRKDRSILFWSGHLAPFYGYLLLTLLYLWIPSGTLGEWSQLLILSEWTKVPWNLHFMGYLIALVFEFRKFEKRLSRTAMIIVLGTASIWFFNLLFFLYPIWIQPLPIIVYLNITLLFSVMTLYLFYRKFGVGVDPVRKMSRKNAANSQGFDAKTDPIALAILQHKYYSNPDLDIRTLSEQLRIPYHELSNYINRHYGQNFNAFINSFRIQEVVRALETKQHQSYTIIGLAQKAGFKSASSFYAAFKKEKGTTPSAFLKQSV